ncbi:hypothetical protein OESDEN_24242 [Oesophagostomum dentatum]|uniref:Uncharacterized protein n=1 Tax=Oesophagostomum dentatum TaxID=61180 RepID=A0A0B1RU04_OESDE|nr:hypothetical protein OESDEN_24242 [Oesophagostomum dentatum]
MQMAKNMSRCYQPQRRQSHHYQSLLLSFSLFPGKIRFLNKV